MLRKNQCFLHILSLLMKKTANINSKIMKIINYFKAGRNGMVLVICSRIINITISC